ncbi:MAG: hypothetical protein V2I35_13440 [Desulfocapsaceae bacterium]|jgi:DNA polymerase-3 subunit delta|nr:hypothetical protein [Desulfocapsaceae bacterium]
MPIHKRTEINKLLKDIEEGRRRQLYLCFGERYLCRQTAELIEQALMGAGGGAVHSIDGSTEENNKILSRVLSFSLLPGVQVYRINDSNLFLSKNIGSQIWEKALQAHQQGNSKRAVRHLFNLLNAAGITAGGTAVFSDISGDQ